MVGRIDRHALRRALNGVVIHHAGCAPFNRCLKTLNGHRLVPAWRVRRCRSVHHGLDGVSPVAGSVVPVVGATGSLGAETAGALVPVAAGARSVLLAGWIMLGLLKKTAAMIATTTKTMATKAAVPKKPRPAGTTGDAWRPVVLST